MAKLSQTSRRSLVLLLAAAVLAVVLLALPVFEFNVELYTKRSGNTFVGDEKYLAAHAEAERITQEYRAQGLHGEISLSENVIERVNSKGAKTSMVTFDVHWRVTRTGWEMMASGLPGAKLLLASVVCFALALIGVLATLREAPGSLRKPYAALRGLGCWLALAAALLVPAFTMSAVYTLGRQLILHLDDPASVRPLLDTVSRLVYGAIPYEDTAETLKTLAYRPTWALWTLLPAYGLMLLSAILLCKGALGRTLARGALYLFVIVLCVVILYPYYVMLITGFRSNAETTDMYFTHMLPTKWVWTNVTDIAARGVPRFLLNSLILSSCATLVALVCGIPAAYAMARMNFKGRKIFLGFVIMSQMFSPVVLLVGISQLMNAIHLNDSLLGLIFINAAFNQAFAIWLLRGTFVSISPEMEQAACIDGCNTVGALLHILLPMAAPGIVTTLIFVFINAWNEYTISTVLISTPTLKPITVGITQFSSFNMIEWQYLFASALIATIPVVIMFMCIEKHLVSGLTSGGVKG